MPKIADYLASLFPSFLPKQDDALRTLVKRLFFSVKGHSVLDQNPQNCPHEVVRLNQLSDLKMKDVYLIKNNKLSSGIKFNPFLKPILYLRLNNETAFMKKNHVSIEDDMVANLPIEEFEKEGVNVFRVGGRLDATSAPILERKLLHVVETPGAKVVVDLKNLSYLSSAGMRVMLSASKRLKSKNGNIAFSSAQPEVMEIIKLAGFEHILQFFQTEAIAMKALKSLSSHE